MNTDLVNHVEQLSQSCMHAKAGDIATLAALLEQCETLRELGSMHQLDGVSRPAAALSEHIKRMIMGESGDESTDMQALRDAVTVLQAALARNEMPRPEAFPPGIGVGHWADAPAGAGNGGSRGGIRSRAYRSGAESGADGRG